MTGDIEFHRTKVEACWCKILLPKIFYPSVLFYLSGNGGAVVGRYVELFDSSKISV